MKKVILIFITAILFTSCQKEEDVISTNEKTANSTLDNSYKSLYKGLMNTFDTSLKANLVINVGNDGNYIAEATFLNGDILIFNSASLGSDENITFSNSRGSFTVTNIENNTIEIDNLILDKKAGYIKAYKLSKGLEVTVLMGTFVDSGDAAFIGNWDMINRGTQITPTGFFSSLVIEDVVVSTPSGYMFSDENMTFENPGSCVFPAPVPWLYDDGGSLLLLQANSQVSTFNGIDCNWGTFYGVNGATITYRDESCVVSTSGSWSWNGRNGTFSVL